MTFPSTVDAFYNGQYIDNQETLPIGGNNHAKRVVIFDSNGNEIISGGSSSAALTSVAGNASSVSLLVANPSRKGLIIHNDSAAILYVAFAGTASSTAFTYRLNPYDTLEPKINYNGAISGIWASATGNARITELT